MAVCYWNSLARTGTKYLPLVQLIPYRCKSLTLDVFDDFTSQLREKKASKWENIRTRYKQLQVTQHIEATGSYACVTAADVDGLLSATVENGLNRFNEILEACKQLKYCPSSAEMLDFLAVCAQKGKHNTIDELKGLYRQFNTKFLKHNSDFDLYLAEALWTSGSVIKALNMFETIYKNNRTSRHQVCYCLKRLIPSLSDKCGDAILVSLFKFCKRLHVEFDDSYLLTFVWQMSFLSEFYCDQSKAIEMLETDDKLLNVVLHRLPFVVNVALSNHNTDTVNALLEFLLKKELQTEYANLLGILFDYKGLFLLYILKIQKRNGWTDFLESIKIIQIRFINTCT